MIYIEKMIIIKKKLFLFRCTNIGAVTYRLLLNNFGLDGAIAYTESVLKENNKYKISSWVDIDEEIENTIKFGAKFITKEDEDFPKINGINDFPPILTVIGNTRLLKKNIITVIGTRNPSLQSRQYTKYLCKKWREKDYVIASGMAIGIDTSAHEENIENTIAVLPGGINVIYPKQNYFLYHQIKEKGLLMSSCYFDEQITYRHFPKRNRLLAALGDGIVVTEAMKNSGSLLTASYGEQYFKPIFSVPGHPLDIRYEGNNILLKRGAYLLDDPSVLMNKISSLLLKDNILPTFKIKDTINTNIPFKEKENIKRIVKNLLSITPLSIHDLIEYTKFNIGDVNYILMEMEILGEIERTCNGYISLIIDVK